jgi:hypothetical protein
MRHSLRNKAVFAQKFASSRKNMQLFQYIDLADPSGRLRCLARWRLAYAFAELVKVQTGLRPVPTVEDFIAELPEKVWPV